MSEEIKNLLSTKKLSPPLPREIARKIALRLGEWVNLKIYSSSLTAVEQVLFFLGQDKKGEKYLGTLVKTSELERLEDFTELQRKGRISDFSAHWQVYGLNSHNAQELKKRISFLSPHLIGLSKSFGCGDRLGIATPAHIQAVRGKDIRPVLAQQSIREMTRTGRSPQEVMDDALWGIFQEGWREGFGADADHLKTTQDIDNCVTAGFTLYTVDPGDYVDNSAEKDTPTSLKEKFSQLPWETLEVKPSDWERKYVGKTFQLTPHLSLHFHQEDFLKAAVKYGWMIVHTVTNYRYLSKKMGNNPFEFEVSIDEVFSPTSPLEHFFIAEELVRLGVNWISLAPRFIGRFEKGVDYIGDLSQFESFLKQHLSVAEYFGFYKLSFHSASDKFSLYPLISRLAGSSFHLKTAGTSYLEALRTVALVAPQLFREIFLFALDRYEEDKATYHVSADLSKIPPVYTLKDRELAKLLDLFDVRQLLHVTFGSVLRTQNEKGESLFREKLKKVLKENEEKHNQILSSHLEKHLIPFS